MRYTFFLFTFNELCPISKKRICYPENAAAFGKGWCVTQEPHHRKLSGVDHLGYDSGWGFCSSDPSQVHCHEDLSLYNNEKDPTSKKVSILSDSFCINRLGENLQFEQPNVKSTEYQDLRLVRHEHCWNHLPINSFQHFQSILGQKPFLYRQKTWS